MEDVDVKEVLLQVVENERKELPFSLTVKDLQELLPLSDTRIYNLLISGEIPGKKIGGEVDYSNFKIFNMVPLKQHGKRIQNRTGGKSVSYVLQVNLTFVGWSDIEAFGTLEEAIKAAENRSDKKSDCRIIKLVATFEEKYETKIHGEGDN